VPRSFLDPMAAPPAPGQGALAIQTRAEDVGADWVKAMRCEATTLAVAAERGALTALEGSCRTAVGAHARLSGRRLSLIVEALSPDGVHRFRREGEVDLGADAETDARDLGLRLGEAVRLAGGDLIVLKD